MTVQEQLDIELERRSLSRLKPETIAQVRDLCRHPETALEIFYERLQLGWRMLDQRETENRWQLWELLITAYRLCQIELDTRRRQTEDAETERIRNDPQRQAEIRRRKALNYRSGQEHLKHEQSGLQVPLQLPATDKRHPTLIRRHRKGKQ